MNRLIRFFATCALAAAALTALAGPMDHTDPGADVRALHIAYSAGLAAEAAPRSQLIKSGWGTGTTRAAIPEPGVLLLLGAGLLAAGLARK